jgi:predicted metal-dependent hydrolase
MSGGSASQLSLFDALNGAAPMTIRRSARARRLSVRVHRNARVEVVAPPRVSERAVRQFVDSHRDWIDQRVRQAQRDAPPPTEFPPREIALPAIAESWRLHLSGGTGRLRLRSASAGVLSIGGVCRADAPGDRAAAAELKRILRSWLMRRGRDLLQRELAGVAARTGLRFARISLRRQRTRWGSCSACGTISLNVSLLFQRPQVLHYLLLHELTHTQHMNHSKRFWQAVERHCPQWRSLDRELLAGWRQVPSWVFD